MSFLSKVIGIGAAAAAAAVAVKVAKKYEENKELNTLSEEETVSPPEEPTDAQPYYEEQAENIPASDPEPARNPVAEIVQNVQRAAGGVWSDTRNKVKETAEKMGVDAEEVGSALGEAGRALVGAGKAVAGAGVAVASKVAEKAPDVVEKVRDQAGDLVSQIKDTVYAAAADEEDEPEMGQTPSDYSFDSDSQQETEFPAGEEPRDPLPGEEDDLQV